MNPLHRHPETPDSTNHIDNLELADAVLSPRTSAGTPSASRSARDTLVRHDEVEPFLDADDESSLGATKDTAVTIEETSSMRLQKADWLPLTLRLPYLVFLIVLSAILGVLVSILTAISAQNYGLGIDRASPTLFFDWRFSPTLVATIYALLVGSMLNDVRRTEIFARLSRPGGATAAHTLCFPARSWWHDPFDALKKTKNNGVRSLALFSASLVNMLVLLVVSPLSAGFLSPIDVTISRDTAFRGTNLAPDATWQSDSFNSVVFRTIAGSVLNKSTSAWINSESAVLPFWPSDAIVPTGSSFAADFTAQQWESPTTVYKSELDCVPLRLQNVSSYTIKIVGVGSTVMTTTELGTSDGCNITITEDKDSLQGYHGGWLPESPSDPKSFLGQFGTWKHSEQCNNRSTILVKHYDEDTLSFNGSVCAVRYYSAAVNATVDISETSTMVSFDDNEYKSNRKLLDLTQQSFTHLEEIFLNSNWSNKFFSTVILETPAYTGPLLAIAASPDYNNDAEVILNSTVLLERASRLHQQYFGEMLLLALVSTATDLGSGKVLVRERRIFVVSSIAITLAVLLLLSSLCVVVVLCTTRLRQRPLHLSHDPGSITAVASLVAGDRLARQEFHGMDKLSNGDMTALLAKRRFAIEHGELIAMNDAKLSPEDENPQSDNSDPRPVMIRIWMATLLLAILAALIAALVILYNLSRTGRLSQALLVNQLNIDVMELSTTLTPYSIIPTLIAVAVKLWFRASAETFKRLQPFVSITNSPSSTSDSVSAEYANTPIALASIKALKHSHWILALIGVGAFVTEAFTVGMSALWDRKTQDTYHMFNVSRQLELRSSPQLFHHPRVHTALSANEAVLGSVFGASLQNWLYGATIELTQSASTPPWSKDTWSFVPLDGRVTREAASSLNVTIRNMTIETPALRARLECQIVDYGANRSAWLVETDFRNTKTWNRTNTPAGLERGYYLNEIAARGPGLRTVACCANQTQEALGDALVGYWSDTSSSTIPLSMQAKWIVGRPLNESYTQKPTAHENIAYERWIWPEAPQIAAIDCAPVIEQAEASIVVDFETGVVYDYEILEAPQNATNAWTDFYFYHGADTSQAAHWQENITTSYGYIFWDSLLESANAGALVFNKLLYAGPEDLSDGIFNFRGPGLNTDFMSYSMLAMANNSKEALLDPITLMDFANKTFGVFFKHFVSEEVNSTAGGRAYQPIGERLPLDLGPVTYGSKITANQGALALQDTITPTPKDTQASLIIPVEQLIMSPIAFFLSISLLSFLVLTTIIMYSVNRAQYKTLPRDVDTLASMIAFIYGSEKLLAWSRDSQQSAAWYRSWTSKSQPPEHKEMKAQMGSFYDMDGKERWGIELVGTMNPQPQQARNDSSEVEMQYTRDANVDGGDNSGVRSALLGKFDWEMGRKGAIRRKPVPE